MKMKFALRPALASIAVALLTVNSQAATIVSGTMIGIDFGPTAPTNFFNQVINTPGGTISAGSIIDTSNVVVDNVSFTWDWVNFTNNDSTNSTDLPGQPSIFNDSNLTDWVGENDNDEIILTFSGLDDSLTYDLVIGSGFINNDTNVDTQWTVDGQQATTDHAVGSDAYVTFTGLNTDGSGNLLIESTAANTGRFTVVSALQLTATAIPEPATALLGLMGSLLLFRRRRCA